MRPTEWVNFNQSVDARYSRHLMGLLNHTLCAHHVQNKDRFPEQLPRLAAPTSNLQTTQSHEGFRPMKHPKGTPCSQHSDTTNGCFNLCCMSGPQPSDWAPLHAKPSGRITQCRVQPTCHVAVPSALHTSAHHASEDTNMQPVPVRPPTHSQPAWSQMCMHAGSPHQSNTQQTPRQTPHQPWMPSCSA